MLITYFEHVIHINDKKVAKENNISSWGWGGVEWGARGGLVTGGRARSRVQGPARGLDVGDVPTTAQAFESALKRHRPIIITVSNLLTVMCGIIIEHCT